MANLIDKIFDGRSKSIFHIRLDTAEVTAQDKIVPEALYGAVVKLNFTSGASAFQLGEDVSQASTGATANIIGITGDTILTLSANRNSVGVFTGASNLVTGATTGANETPTSKVIPSDQRVSIFKMKWTNFGFTGATDAIGFQWEATASETFIKLHSGSGSFDIPSAIISPNEITGLTGIIQTILPTISANSFASILIEVHKKTQGYFYPDK